MGLNDQEEHDQAPDDDKFQMGRDICGRISPSRISNEISVIALTPPKRRKIFFISMTVRQARRFPKFVPIVSRCYAMPETLVSHGFLMLAVDMSLDPHAVFNMTRSGLNRIQQGLSIYDADLKLAVSNRRLKEMFGLPNALIQTGADFSTTIRFLVETGEYVEVEDIDLFVQQRVDQALAFEPHYVERTRASGMVISIEGSHRASRRLGSRFIRT